MKSNISQRLKMKIKKIKLKRRSKKFMNKKNIIPIKNHQKSIIHIQDKKIKSILTEKIKKISILVPKIKE
jgi:hypothetical protein